MKLLLLAAFVAVALSQLLEISAEPDPWEFFKITYVKKYSNKDKEQEKKNTFMKNLKFIQEHNAKFQKGEVTYDVAVNKFADMTAEEFHKQMALPEMHPELPGKGETYNMTDHGALPATVDWRAKGAVTGVKDQNHCGACWAFSATGSIEGQVFIKTKKLVSLSEQNLIDCSHEGGNRGCQGGLDSNAFDYVKNNHGIDSEASYPYEDKEGKCRYKAGSKAANVMGKVFLPRGDEKALKDAVAKVGPISVAIDDSGIKNGFSPLQFYKKGVYIDPNCSKIYHNHELLVVGYGTVTAGGDYWLVKNSWGTSWGMNGYIMFGRNHDNMCGIANSGVYPLVPNVI